MKTWNDIAIFIHWLNMLLCVHIKLYAKKAVSDFLQKNEKLFALRFTQVIVIQWAPLIHTYFVCIQTNTLWPKIHLQWCLIRIRTFSWEWYCGNIQCVLELTSYVNMRRKHMHIGLKTRCCPRCLHVDIWLKYNCDKETRLPLFYLWT